MMANDILSINPRSGHGIFDTVFMREKIIFASDVELNDLTVTKGVNLTGDLVVTGTGTFGEVSSPDIEHAQWAYTDTDVPVDISPVPGWDATTVKILGTSGLGTITAINATSGVMSFEPLAGYQGMITYLYQQVDNNGITRRVMQFVGVEVP